MIQIDDFIAKLQEKKKEILESDNIKLTGKEIYLAISLEDQQDETMRFVMEERNLIGIKYLIVENNEGGKRILKNFIKIETVIPKNSDQ